MGETKGNVKVGIGHDEQIVEDDNVPFDEEVAALLRKEEKQPVDRVFIKAMARKNTLCKILKVAIHTQNDLTFMEYWHILADNKLMSPHTINLRLKQLVKIGIFDCLTTPLSSRMKYYRIKDRKLVELILKRHSLLVGYKLVRELLPKVGSYLDLNSLMHEELLNELYRKYLVTYNEIIDALMRCHKVECIANHRRELVGFKRIVM